MSTGGDMGRLFWAEEHMSPDGEVCGLAGAQALCGVGGDQWNWAQLFSGV